MRGQDAEEQKKRKQRSAQAVPVGLAKHIPGSSTPGHCPGLRCLSALRATGAGKTCCSRPQGGWRAVGGHIPRCGRRRQMCVRALCKKDEVRCLEFTSAYRRKQIPATLFPGILYTLPQISHEHHR